MAKISVGKNVDLYVQDWGAGKTLVFIHGWPLDHRIFDYQMLALAKRDCRVVAIDLRGFGRSAQTWEGNDYDTWAADIGKVIAGLILRDVTLVGFSLGGAIAAHYVARRIDTRISKLALISAPVVNAAARSEDKQITESNIKALLTDRPKFILEHIKSMIHTPVSRESLEWLTSIGMMSSLRADIRALEELRDRDLRPSLGNIRIPTRFFHGVMDEIIPISLAETEVGLIKGASLVRFENSGHAIFWDEKDKLVDELEKFSAEKVARAAA